MFFMILFSVATGIVSGFLYGLFFVQTLTLWCRKDANSAHYSQKISVRSIVSAAFSYGIRYLLIAGFFFYVMMQEAINISFFIMSFGGAFWGAVIMRSWLERDLL